MTVALAHQNETEHDHETQFVQYSAGDPKLSGYRSLLVAAYAPIAITQVSLIQTHTTKMQSCNFWQRMS